MENQNFNAPETGAGNNAQTMNAAPQAGMVQKSCPRCGNFLPQTAVQCNVCGYVFDAPQAAPQGMPQTAPQGMPQTAAQGMPQTAPQAENANEAISNFNTQVEKKNKKKKTLPIIIAVVLVLVIAIGGMFVMSISQADAVVAAINREEIDSEAVDAAYSQLNPIGKLFFSGKIQDAFVAKVKATPYVASDSKIPLNPTSMLNYYDFEEIAEIIGVTSSSHPSVMAYIDAVLALDEYMPYNSLYFCVYLSFDGYSDAISQLASSFSASSVRKAYNYVSEGYEKGQEYNDNDMTEAYMQTYYAVYKELKEWDTYGYKLYGSYATDVDLIIDAYDVIKVYMAKIDTARSEVDAKVAALPAID